MSLRESELGRRARIGHIRARRRPRIGHIRASPLKPGVKGDRRGRQS